jgi:MSHA biogenesis protein MshQ
MKRVRQVWNQPKWTVLGVALCMLMTSATANATAIAFGGGVIAGCTLSGTTYTCASSPSTFKDAIAVGANYIVTITGSGDIHAFTAALGVNGVINGNLISASTVALGVGAYVTGNLTAGTTVALGVDSYVVRNMTAGSTVAMGVGSYVGRNLTAGTTVALGANSYVCLNLTALTVAMGANSFVHRNLTATTATLGADAYVNRDLTAVTVTIGANGYVNGVLAAGTTATLGAGVCFGSRGPGAAAYTIGAGAGEGVCPLIRPHTSCSPIIYGRENY